MPQIDRSESNRVGGYARWRGMTPEERSASTRDAMRKAREQRAANRLARLKASGTDRLTPKERAVIARKNLAKGRAMQAAAVAARRAPPAPKLITDRLSPAQIMFRAEKKAKLERDAVLIAQAKVVYDAALAAQERVGRGGRPKGRGILVRTDPADVLIRALEGGR